MSLRHIDHQIAIEMGEMDTEYVTVLKYEKKQLREECRKIGTRGLTLGMRQRRAAIKQRLRRIEELLNK